MFNFFRKRFDPQKARVELSDLFEEIRITCFPTFLKSPLTKEPIGDNPLKKAYAHDMFNPDYHDCHFQLGIGFYALYVAEATLTLPELTEKKYLLSFSSQCTSLAIKFGWANIKVKDNRYDNPKEIIKSLLGDCKTDLGKDADELTDLILGNIHLGFFGPLDDHEDLIKGKKITNMVYDKFSPDAKKMYQEKVDQELKEGFRIFSSKTYTYHL